MSTADLKPIHNFDGPGASGLYIDAIGMVVVWVTLAVRLYVRGGMLKSMGIDDYFMIASAFCYSWMAITIIQACWYGFGQHFDELPTSELIVAFQYYLTCQLGYTAAILFFKVSVSFFYLRITIVKWQRYTIYTLVTINILYTFGYFFVILFQCTPISYLWTRLDGGKGTCAPDDVIINCTYTHNAISLVSDWTLATLPIFLLKNANLNRKTKFIVLLLLGLGFFASTASIIRITTIHALNSSADYTRTAIPIIVWSAVEITICIFTANLATYRPLFQLLFSTVSGDSQKAGATTGNRSRNPWAKRSSNRHSGDGYILNGMGHDMHPSRSRSTEEVSINGQKVVCSRDMKFAQTESELSDEEAGIVRHTDIVVVESWDRNYVYTPQANQIPTGTSESSEV